MAAESLGMDWQAISAIGTFLAAGVALWLGLRSVKRENSDRQDEAKRLLARIQYQLAGLKKTVVEPGQGKMSAFIKPQKEGIEDLIELSFQAHLLDTTQRKLLDGLVSTYLDARIFSGNPDQVEIVGKKQDNFRTKFKEAYEGLGVRDAYPPP